eukprot:628348-Pyramimonas_sp.AAC.1
MVSETNAEVGKTRSCRNYFRRLPISRVEFLFPLPARQGSGGDGDPMCFQFLPTSRVCSLLPTDSTSSCLRS